MGYDGLWRICCAVIRRLDDCCLALSIGRGARPPKTVLQPQSPIDILLGACGQNTVLTPCQLHLHVWNTLPPVEIITITTERSLLSASETHSRGFETRMTSSHFTQEIPPSFRSHTPSLVAHRAVGLVCQKFNIQSVDAAPHVTIGSSPFPTKPADIIRPTLFHTPPSPSKQLCRDYQTSCRPTYAVLRPPFLAHHCPASTLLLVQRRNKSLQSGRERILPERTSRTT